MVPMEGVEPTHSYEYQILSLARLPIPPHRPSGAGKYKSAGGGVNKLFAFNAASPRLVAAKVSSLQFPRKSGYAQLSCRKVKMERRRLGCFPWHHVSQNTCRS